MNDRGSSLHKAVQHDTYAKNLERYSTRPEDIAIKGYIRNMRNHTDEVVPHPFNKDRTFRNLRPDEKIRVLADEGRRKKALLNKNSGSISSYKDSLTLPDKPVLTKKEIRTREKAMKNLKKEILD